MTSAPKIVNDQAIALTVEELKVLQDILDTGDRAGYYMAYSAMTGIEAESLLYSPTTLR